MAIWAIGDVQGCLTELELLLNKVQQQDAAAQFWLGGDLVNRGPDSLGVLRLLQSMGGRVQCVLGNHDLYALACAAGFMQPKAGDTMYALLAAPAEWVDWLRAQPLMLEMSVNDHPFCLSHAGLFPQFDLPTARQLTSAVSALLQAPNWAAQLERLWHGNQRYWLPTNDESLENNTVKTSPSTGSGRTGSVQRPTDAQLRFTINAMMRMRLIAPDGGLDFKVKESVSSAPAGYVPWFDVPNPLVTNTTLVFGHWSALGLINREHLIALDTGCVWGRCLTAVELVQPAVARRVVQVAAAKY